MAFHGKDTSEFYVYLIDMLQMVDFLEKFPSKLLKCDLIELAKGCFVPISLEITLLDQCSQLLNEFSLSIQTNGVRSSRHELYTYTIRSDKKLST